LVFWFRRLDHNQVADAEIVRHADGTALTLGMTPGCHVTDWDDDGDHDFILSGRSKPENDFEEIWFVENKGSASRWNFAAPKPLEVEHQSNKLPPGGICPFVADWNGDGRQDLLMGRNDGSVLYCENRGTRKNPSLAPPRNPVKAGGIRRPDVEGVQRAREGLICVTDWDQDGTADILMGDFRWDVVRHEFPADTGERIEELRAESVRILKEYRKVRRLGNRLDQEQRNQKALVRQTQENYGKRLDEVHAEMARLEKLRQPEQRPLGFIWLLKRSQGDDSK
jgi:hypothetical protein